MDLLKIENCYDSHVHWEYTGSWVNQLSLRELSSPQNISKLPTDKKHYRGDWVRGFGWDDNIWSEKPTRQHLDEVFGDKPVAFSRIDGHALWVNTEALKRSGLFKKFNSSDVSGGKIILDSQGYPTGVLVDMAMTDIFKSIPKKDIKDIERDLLLAVDTFNKSGFTHIRDLSCNDKVWSIAKELEKQNLLKLHVDCFFECEDPNKLDKVIGWAQEAVKEETELLSVGGVKIYYDGALGSEGALLSQCYANTNENGFRIYSQDELKKIIKKVWSKNLPIAIHAIGDLAADEVIESAVFVSENDNINGEIHIEHAQIINEKTLKKAKGLNIIFHLQPCHWLSDKKWLKEKIKDLFLDVFPWKKLEEGNFNFFFGSDSPIEVPSLKNNYDGVEDLNTQGISKPNKSFQNYHTNLKNPLGDTYSLVDPKTYEIKEVYFKGERVV